MKYIPGVKDNLRQPIFLAFLAAITIISLVIIFYSVTSKHSVDTAPRSPTVSSSLFNNPS